MDQEERKVDQKEEQQKSMIESLGYTITQRKLRFTNDTKLFPHLPKVKKSQMNMYNVTENKNIFCVPIIFSIGGADIYGNKKYIDNERFKELLKSNKICFDHPLIMYAKDNIFTSERTEPPNTNTYMVNTMYKFPNIEKCSTGAWDDIIGLHISKDEYFLNDSIYLNGDILCKSTFDTTTCTFSTIIDSKHSNNITKLSCVQHLDNNLYRTQHLDFTFDKLLDSEDTYLGKTYKRRFENFSPLYREKVIGYIVCTLQRLSEKNQSIRCFNPIDWVVSDWTTENMRIMMIVNNTEYKIDDEPNTCFNNSLTRFCEYFKIPGNIKQYHPILRDLRLFFQTVHDIYKTTITQPITITTFDINRKIRKFTFPVLSNTTLYGEYLKSKHIDCFPLIDENYQNTNPSDSVSRTCTSYYENNNREKKEKPSTRNGPPSKQPLHVPFNQPLHVPLYPSNGNELLYQAISTSSSSQVDTNPFTDMQFLNTRVFNTRENSFGEVVDSLQTPIYPRGQPATLQQSFQPIQQQQPFLDTPVFNMRETSFGENGFLYNENYTDSLQTPVYNTRETSFGENDFLDDGNVVGEFVHSLQTPIDRRERLLRNRRSRSSSPRQDHHHNNQYSF